jgi:hypothetical protein
MDAFDVELEVLDHSRGTDKDAQSKDVPHEAHDSSDRTTEKSKGRRSDDLVK